QPDRPGGRRARTPEPEQAPDRNARELSAEVVQGHVDGGPRRVLAGEGREAAFDLVERERVVAEQRARVREKGGRRVDALTVVVLGRGLSVARPTFVLDLDED